MSASTVTVRSRHEQLVENASDDGRLSIRWAGGRIVHLNVTEEGVLEGKVSPELAQLFAQDPAWEVEGYPVAQDEYAAVENWFEEGAYLAAKAKGLAPQQAPAGGNTMLEALIALLGGEDAARAAVTQGISSTARATLESLPAPAEPVPAPRTFYNYEEVSALFDADEARALLEEIDPSFDLSVHEAALYARISKLSRSSSNLKVRLDAMAG